MRTYREGRQTGEEERELGGGGVERKGGKRGKRDKGDRETRGWGKRERMDTETGGWGSLKHLKQYNHKDCKTFLFPIH